ncbi:hypothetical protein, partial [Pseudomonas syringae]|uniref:hypothetical protein n=1 Tax=Pseudomonas syringae TaxID=317 RepID=UPI003CF09752
PYQITIQILDARVEIIGFMNLPASISLSELAPLKILGSISVKVVACSTTFAGVSAWGVQ